jgi:hypothetical protein
VSASHALELNSVDGEVGIQETRRRPPRRRPTGPMELMVKDLWSQWRPRSCG